MNVFRVTTFAALGVSAAGIAVLAGIRAIRTRRTDGPDPDETKPTLRRWSLWERLVHLALTVSACGLIVTGFAPQLLWGLRTHGWWVMVHVSFGGVFLVALALMVLTWQGRARLAPGDGHWLIHRLPRVAVGADAGESDIWDPGQKMLFWLTAWTSLVVGATMVLAMTPLLGTAGIELLYEIHRYAAVVLTVLLIFHTYIMLAVKRGAAASMLHGRVSRRWAERHHRRWLRQIEKQESP